MFLGCSLIPKVGRGALKQLRFLSCSHGSVSLRTGNGAGLQTMSWILPSLKSLAEIPGTGYKLCVSGGAPEEQSALSSAGQLNRPAGTGGALQGTHWTGRGTECFTDLCPEVSLELPVNICYN